MSQTTPRYVSVKFSPIGRPQTFLLNDLLFADAPPPGSPTGLPSAAAADGTRTGQPRWGGLVAGDKVVVQSEAGSAVGAVVSTPAAVIERRQPPAHSPNRVVRKATAEDVIVRLKRQQREQEAHRVALL